MDLVLIKLSTLSGDPLSTGDDYSLCSVFFQYDIEKTLIKCLHHTRRNGYLVSK